MHLTNQVTADQATIMEFVNNYPAGQPLVMLNILKFKTRSGQGDESGEAAYNRYGRNVQPVLEKAGAKVIWAGQVNQVVIGDQSQQPDRILLVEYPSKAAFLKMVSSEAYQAVAHDRLIALEYGGLVATETMRF